MKDQIRIIALIAGIAVLISHIAYSQTVKVPVCLPTDFQSKQQSGFRLQIEDLPKALYVARESYQEIKGAYLGMISRQSFIKPKSKVECVASDNKTSINLGLIAPVLIDMTSDQKTKNSFWQFQTMLKENRAGVWNQKSKALSDHMTMEAWLKKQNGQVEFYQLSHHEFVLVIKTKVLKNDVLQKIYFDLIDE